MTRTKQRFDPLSEFILVGGVAIAGMLVVAMIGSIFSDDIVQYCGGCSMCNVYQPLDYFCIISVVTVVSILIFTIIYVLLFIVNLSRNFGR